MTDEKNITDTTTPIVAIETPAAPVSAPAEQISTAATETISSAVADPSAIPTAEVPTEKIKIESETAPKVETTALGGDTTEIKSDSEKVKPETDNKDESKQSEEPAPLPTYEPFKMPEGIILEDTKLVEFNKELAEFEIENKADHAKVQAFGQKLIDRYTAELQHIQENIQKQLDTIVSGWKEAFDKDSEIGGNRRDTTVKNVQKAVEAHAGTAEQLAEFRSFVNETRTGEHPAFIRLVHNMDRALKDKDDIISAYKTKYESEDGVKPLAGTKPEADKPQKIYNKMYGTASNNL